MFIAPFSIYYICEDVIYSKYKNTQIKLLVKKNLGQKEAR